MADLPENDNASAEPPPPPDQAAAKAARRRVFLRFRLIAYVAAAAFIVLFPARIGWKATLLRLVVGAADRVVVTEGPGFGGDDPMVLDLADAKAVREWVQLVRTEEEGFLSAMVCACNGQFGLDFYRGSRRLARVRLTSDGSLKWRGGLWQGDAPLVDGSMEKSLAWFDRHGVEGPRRQWNELAAARRRSGSD